MSVLIKGMKMPEDCVTCLMCDKGADGMWYCVATMTNLSDKLEDMIFFRPNWCPLVEVPTPHGRLIDYDALNLEYEVEMADDWKTAHEIANCVKYAPTIIEAEE